MIIVATLKQVHHEILETHANIFLMLISITGHGYLSSSGKMVVVNTPELWMQVGACFGMLTSIASFHKMKVH